MAGLEVDEQLKGKILEMAGREGKSRGIARRHFRASIALALCFCLLFTIAAAAAVPELRERFLRLISPQYEEFAPEVSAASAAADAAGKERGDRREGLGSTAVDQGIFVEVTNAVTDGKTMAAYIEIRDPERTLGGPADIYDYSLNGFTFLNTQMIGWDSTAGTARFCLLAGGGGMPKSGNVRYQISSLMTKGQKYEDFNTEIELENLIQEATGQYVDWFGGGGSQELLKQAKSGGEEDKVLVLECGAMEIPLRSDIDFVWISNVGYLDGYLHIQTKWSDSYDNHGDVYLLEGQGSRIPSASISFDGAGREKEKKGYRSEYTEYVYDLDGADLEDCTLNAFFSREGERIDGDWKMEFSVSSVEDESIELEGQGMAQKLVISPMGIYLCGTQEEYQSVTVYRKNGTSEQAAGRFEELEDGTRSLLFVMNAPIEVENVARIELDGRTVYDSGL